MSGSPANFAAGAASVPIGGASHAGSVGARRADHRRPSAARAEAGVEPRDREVALVAAVVTRQRIDGHADESAPPADRGEEHLVGGPDAGERRGLFGHALFRAQVAHQRHPERGVGQFVCLDSLTRRVVAQKRDARAQPRRRDPIGVQHHHPAGPVPAAAVPPQRPGHLCQFGVARLRAEIGERLLERRVGAVPRVAPHLAVGLLRLLVGRGEERATVFLRQRLPVQVVRAGEARPARPLAAPVLVDDHPAERLHARGNPDRVVRPEDQFSRFVGRLVTHAVVRRFGGREDVVGRLLGVEVGRPRGEEDHDRAIAFRCSEHGEFSCCRRLSHLARDGQDAFGPASRRGRDGRVGKSKCLLRFPRRMGTFYIRTPTTPPQCLRPPGTRQ
ncbi:hypothetical protein FTUN_2111 [Frigoriglobus tundricola]|uniref:Uncharacterized protein n=1 Tax=Frigoriglobus tundricola TaxID=2774151 RepID=A0A6M5YMM2_9BACT|nr:hypothetical protein FTUN_2111 [Frigoriglobus tundricola]